MGSWGTGIFESDVAADVQGDYDKLRQEGLGVAAATRALLDAYEDALADADDRPVLWMALAAAQLNRGEIDARVRDTALAALEAGGDLERWRDEAEASDVAEREHILADLGQRLLSAQPTQA